jgi:hypothetical protein
MWSNQNTMKMYFAAHTDGASDNNWQSVVAYATSADDHINLKSLASDSAGSLFAVVKTSLSSKLILLLACSSGAACTAAGNWSSYSVYDSNTYNPTRPILLIDIANRLLYVFTSNQDANGKAAIYYKKTSMDSIQFPAGIGAPFIKSATDTKIDDPSSTKQNLNNLTGVVILASDASTKYYFHNNLGGTSPPIQPGDEIVFLPFMRRSP